MPAKLDIRSIDGNEAHHLEFETNQEAADVLTSYAGKPYDINYTPIGIPDNTMDRRLAAIREAETWLRTPFQMNGAIKGVVIDCGHFLAEVYRSVGIPVPDVTENFTIDWHMHARSERLLNIVLPYADRVEVPEPGDIVMFKVARVYAHFGIVIKWPQIIHAMWGHGVEYCNVDQDTDLKRRTKIFLSPFNRK